MASVVKSLAATGKAYVVVQARMYRDGLHVQGAGPKANRDYGIAVTLPVSQEVREFVSLNEDTKFSARSLAKTGKRYFLLQARPRPGYIHFQAPDGAKNRVYGLAFDIDRNQKDTTDLWIWLAEALLPA